MKVIRTLLVMCFLLAMFGVNTVSAQNDQTGFIPLLTENYDTSVSREQLSFERLKLLLPQLVEAEENGVISGFEPDLYGGFLKITYSGDVEAQNISGIPVFSEMMAAVVPAPSTLTSSDVTDTASAPNASIYLYSNCFNLNNLGSNAKVKAVLYISGVLTGVKNTTANSDGYAWDCFSGTYTKMVPGALIKFAVFNSAGTYQKTISATLPRISFTSLDKTNAILKGTGPAGKAYSARWAQSNLDSGNTFTEKIVTGTIPSAGIWSVDFGTQKIRGNAYVGITVSPNSSIKVINYFWSPALECGIKSDLCYIFGLPSKAVSISAVHNSVTYKVNGKTDFEGFMSGLFTNSYGEPVILKAGDSISGTEVTTYKINSLTATINSANDTITGTAPANTYFTVSVDQFDGNFHSLYVHSDSTGKYTANFSGIFDIPDTFVRGEIEYTDKVTGNVTWYFVMKGY